MSFASVVWESAACGGLHRRQKSLNKYHFSFKTYVSFHESGFFIKFSKAVTVKIIYHGDKSTKFVPPPALCSIDEHGIVTKVSHTVKLRGPSIRINGRRFTFTTYNVWIIFSEIRIIHLLTTKTTFHLHFNTTPI